MSQILQSLCVPEFEADPEVDGTRQSNFAIVNFTKRMIIIGGTAYSGEMKKGIFSVLNYILPHDDGVLKYALLCKHGNRGKRYINFLWSCQELEKQLFQQIQTDC